MEVKATAKYIHISPKKIRLVVEAIKDLPLEEVLQSLSALTHRAARPLLKALNSAIANAEHNFGLKKEDLYIKSLLINQGPSLKRWTAKARGMAAPIKRRTAHIVVVLDTKTAKPSLEKPELKEKEIRQQIPQKIFQPTLVQKIPKEKKIEETITEVKPVIFDRTRLATDRRKQHLDKARLKKKGGFLKRIFRRKAI